MVNDKDNWSEETNIMNNKDRSYTPRGYIVDKATNTRTLISRKRFMIGRSHDCDLMVDDPSISRIHCSIFDTDVNFIIEDMDSTNGTFINNVRIKKKLLKDADLFTIGNREFTFHLF
jgi:pSer/pThr/pTyr-binding forkhead associated (FHA) protein